MKAVLRSFFSPILKPLEAGDSPFSYRKSNRTILIVVGCLFLFLSVSALTAGFVLSQMVAALPSFIFLAVGLFCFIVGALGTDRAVSRVWGGR